MSFKDERDAKHWEAVEEATELLEERRFEDALRTLKELVQKDANNPYAYNLIGTVCWELGKYEAARDGFKAAVLLSPDFLGARISLAHALRKLGQLREAEREARVAIQRKGDDGEAHHALGLALAAQGRREEARRSLELFLLSKPEFEASTEARGVLEMLAQGDDDEPLDVDDD